MNQWLLIALSLILGSIDILHADSASLPTLAFQLSSQAFENGNKIPPPYACDGLNVSPPLNWTTPPLGTQSLALVVQDRDAPQGTFVHWVLYNIPPAVRSLPPSLGPKQHLADGTWQGFNDFGRIGWGGPCPPPRGTHRYIFTLYALDTRLPDKPGYRAGNLGSAMNGHTLASTKLMGTYRKLF